MELLSWTANILAVAGWLVNIKHRKQAMMIFTAATVLSIAYFWNTHQWAFLVRMLIYLVIDIVTLWHIAREPRKP
jgi:hypothetical protein